MLIKNRGNYNSEINNLLSRLRIGVKDIVVTERFVENIISFLSLEESKMMDLSDLRLIQKFIMDVCLEFDMKKQLINFSLKNNLVDISTIVEYELANKMVQFFISNSKELFCQINNFLDNREYADFCKSLNSFYKTVFRFNQPDLSSTHYSSIILNKMEDNGEGKFHIHFDINFTFVSNNSIDGEPDIASFADDFSNIVKSQFDNLNLEYNFNITESITTIQLSFFYSITKMDNISTIYKSYIQDLKKVNKLFYKSYNEYNDSLEAIPSDMPIVDIIDNDYNSIMKYDSAETNLSFLEFDSDMEELSDEDEPDFNFEDIFSLDE